MAERHKTTEPSKVMDVTHPSNVRPSTTSRPVIVSNRPMIPEDPMINQAALSAIDIEKPAGAPKDAAGVPLPSAPEVDRKGKTIIPAVATNEKNEPVAPNEDKSSVDTPTPAQSVANADVQEPSEENSAPKDFVPALSPSEAIDAPEKEQSTHASDRENRPSFSGISGTTDLDEDEEESKTKSKEDKRQEELETLIAAGTYHVPIGQVAKRRGRIVMGIILIILLLVVAVDLSLDMGLFTVAGLPHTNFLH